MKRINIVLRGILNPPVALVQDTIDMLDMDEDEFYLIEDSNITHLATGLPVEDKKLKVMLNHLHAEFTA